MGSLSSTNLEKPGVTKSDRMLKYAVVVSTGLSQ